jgi:hypothetical protein
LSLGRVVSSSYRRFSKMDTALISCLSSNIVSSVGWCVDSGASRHMIGLYLADFKSKKEA